MASQHSQWDTAKGFAGCSCNHNYFGHWWFPPLRRGHGGKWSRRICHRLLTLTAPTSQVCFPCSSPAQQAAAASSSAGFLSLVTHWLMSFTAWYLRRHCRAWQQFLCTKPETNTQLSPCQPCNCSTAQISTHTLAHSSVTWQETACFWTWKWSGQMQMKVGSSVPCSVTKVRGCNSGGSFKPSTSSGCYREQGFQRQQQL